MTSKQAYRACLKKEKEHIKSILHPEFMVYGVKIFHSHVVRNIVFTTEVGGLDYQLKIQRSEVLNSKSHDNFLASRLDDFRWLVQQKAE